MKSIHLHPWHLRAVSCRGTGPPPPPQGADTQNLRGGSCLVQTQAESKRNVPTNAPLRVGVTGSRSLPGLGRVLPNLPSAAVFPLSLFPSSPNPLYAFCLHSQFTLRLVGLWERVINYSRGRFLKCISLQKYQYFYSQHLI